MASRQLTETSEGIDVITLLQRVANRAIRPLGLQIYQSGLDMSAVLKEVAKRPGKIGTVIDLGAASGGWSDEAMRYFPEAKFIGVDPLAEREPKLKELKARKPNFDYELCVAGDVAHAMVELAVGDDLDGSTVGGSHGKVRKVPSRSVDAIVELKNAKGPFILKFDTHGFEVPILRGAAKTLENTKYIVMEMYTYRLTPDTLLFHEMCALLDTLGFRCFNVVDLLQRDSDKAMWQMDFFFARKDDPYFQSSVYK